MFYVRLEIDLSQHKFKTPERKAKETDHTRPRADMSAGYHVQPPESFTFSWSKWARRFERFRLASGLTEKDKLVQVNTLLYSMGDEANNILKSFQLSEDDQKKYETVNSNFDNHFVKKRNYGALLVRRVT